MSFYCSMVIFYIQWQLWLICGGHRGARTFVTFFFSDVVWVANCLFVKNWKMIIMPHCSGKLM